MATALVDPAIEMLLDSREPVIRYRTLLDLVGAADDDPRVRDARGAIPAGPLVRGLLAERPGHPYRKWTGLHWRLVSLMDLRVPPEVVDDPVTLEQELAWLNGRGKAPRRREVPVVDGRARVCGSQDGNALAVAVHFGFADHPRARILADALIDWQWSDGGWNCDRRPATTHSSVNESLPPLRGLAAFARETGDTAAADGADRAAEFFLRHRVAFSERTGRPMHPTVLRLHYPAYWHYDVLAGLRVLAESGHLADPRTADALDLLESKRREDGTWAADEAHYKRPDGAATSLVEVVDWVPGGRGAPSEPITLFALTLLRLAGRLA